MNTGIQYGLIILATALLLLSSCKKEYNGKAKDNLPPQTYTVVDTIIRHGTNSFSSQVQINWWADDPDGFVTGYEYTFDSLITASTIWHFTRSQDSLFVLATPPGHDTVRFQFYVRAIDNLGMKDPTPAHLGYPVKNSPPTLVFVAGVNKPLRSFPVIKYFFSGSDPDGNANLNHFEMCLNDSTQSPYLLDVSVNAITLSAVDFLSLHPAAMVYTNNSLTALSNTANGLVLNDSNRIYLRAVDNAGAHSHWVGSYRIFIKKPVSNFLLVDGYPTGGAAVESFYAQHLQANGISSFDTLQIFQQVGGAYTQLAPDNLTQSRIFNLFHTICWFSNDAVNSFAIGQKTLNDFFNSNGRLLLAVYVSTSFDPQSTALDFTPADTLVVPADTTLLLADTSSLFAQQSGYPTLRSNAYIGTVRPFALASGATDLYHGNIIAKDNLTLSLSPWQRISTLIAKKSNTGGQTNLVLSTLELQKLDGNLNMDAFFGKVMHGEFGL